MLLVGLMVASSALQRECLSGLIAGGFSDLLLVNVTTFLSMGFAVLVLHRYVPWPGTFPYSKWLLVLCLAEALGTAFNTVTMIFLSAAKQTIYSRGSELLATIILTWMFPREFESSFGNVASACVILLALLGSFVIPVVETVVHNDDSWWYMVASLGVVFMRSSAYALMSMVEALLVRNYAVAPSKLLLLEIAGATLLTLIIILPISQKPTVRDSLHTNSPTESFGKLLENPTVLVMYMVFFSRSLMLLIGATWWIVSCSFVECG